MKILSIVSLYAVLGHALETSTPNLPILPFLISARVHQQVRLLPAKDFTPAAILISKDKNYHWSFQVMDPIDSKFGAMLVKTHLETSEKETLFIPRIRGRKWLGLVPLPHSLKVGLVYIEYDQQSQSEKIYPPGREFSLSLLPTGELSGACQTGDGSIWSLHDGENKMAQQLVRAVFDDHGQMLKRENFHFTAHNRDMEWIQCDEMENTLLLGDTGDNQLLRGTFQKSMLSVDNFKQTSEKKAAENFRLEKWVKIKYREARIYSFSADTSLSLRSYDGKKMLRRLGFMKIAFPHGPVDVEAAVLTLNSIDKESELILFEKQNPFQVKSASQVFSLPFRKILKDSKGRRTAIPLTLVEKLGHLNFRLSHEEEGIDSELNSLFITDAGFSPDGKNLYLLTDRGLVRMAGNARLGREKVEAEIRFFPNAWKFSRLQMEALAFQSLPQGGYKVLLGSETLGTFFSFEKGLIQNSSQFSGEWPPWQQLLILSAKDGSRNEAMAHQE